MKIQILLLLSFVALSLCGKSIRSISLRGEDDHDKKPDKHDKFEPCWDCKYPCECDDVPVKHACHASSPVKRQQVVDNTVLWCADGSYFKRLEFKGCYQLNTSCNLIEAGREGRVDNVYTAYKTDDPKEVGKKLRTRNYYQYRSHLNGNVQWYEQARLSNWKDCNEKDILVAFSSWITPNPLTGCCDEGVNHLQATFYQVDIFGPHCSQCYLVQASITYGHKVNN